ncbi:MAG: SRPBCC domain-containing protein [Rhizomicrobium sp.]
MGAELRIVREFDAPRDVVWAAWTDPRAIVRWLGPIEWPAAEVEADVRPGGAWRAGLRAAGGTEMLWQSGRYHTVEPPERLVFSFRWEGTNHPDGPGVDTLVTVVLRETADGRTRMEFTQTGLKSDASAEGHTYGWGSTFGRLDIYLGR